jgi:ATP phosphoribosyltransferase regulatory subunit
LLFSLFGPQRGEALASGGRYDDIGVAFGRRRAATGFSLDLKPLLREFPAAERARQIWAPAGTDDLLWQSIQEHRRAGYAVLQDLVNQEVPDQQTLRARGFDAALLREQAGWKMRQLDS